jgi:hypothetical protein
VEVLDLGLPAEQAKWARAGRVRRTSGQLTSFVTLLRRTAKALRRHRIDIVDCRLNTGTILGAFAGRAAGVQAIVSTDYQLERFESWLWKPFGQAAYSMVDALI